MITVVGWPRSGTHWLKALLEYALGGEVAQSHMWPEAVLGGEHAMIVRDPRDAFASHWRLFRHDNPGTDMGELQFVDYFMRGEGLAQPWGVGWVEHTKRLIQLRLRMRYPFVFYEVLHKLPEKTLMWTVQELEREVQPRRLVRAVQKTIGARCDPSTLPVDKWMGMPGKWATELQPATVWALEEYCGELMSELGYARSTDG